MAEEVYLTIVKKNGMKDKGKLKNGNFSKNSFFFIGFYAIISKKLM